MQDVTQMEQSLRYDPLVETKPEISREEELKTLFDKLDGRKKGELTTFVLNATDDACDRERRLEARNRIKDIFNNKIPITLTELQILKSFIVNRHERQ